MADKIPEIVLGLDAGATPVVLVGDAGHEARDMATLLSLVPGLAAGPHARTLARAANHLAHGNAYAVIEDPKAFAAAYQARLARENPAEPWREGVIRLCDFGVPDYAAITPPALARGRLSFYAEDTFLGVPYLAETEDPTVAPSYTPIPLTPVARPDLPPGPSGSGLNLEPTPMPATLNVADLRDPDE